jgi:dTDP-4-dehydrorhamnose 3,5-epimerase
MAMDVKVTPIAGLYIVGTTPFQDRRGAFARLFCEWEMASVIGSRHIAQINHSRTSSVGAVRGMHYQRAPHAEMKMVRCLKGRVWDVAVDLRQGSPTLQQWYAHDLTPDNALMMVIPEGCAHGFQVMEPDSELLYLHTAAYAPAAEGGVRHDDPAIGIDWPLPVCDLSDRDRQHPLLTHEFQGLEI